MAKRKVRYGFVCNGEHGQLFDTKQEADEYLISERARAVQEIADGWCHPKTTIRDFRMHIQEIKGRIW